MLLLAATAAAAAVAAGRVLANVAGAYRALAVPSCWLLVVLPVLLLRCAAGLGVTSRSCTPTAAVLLTVLLTPAVLLPALLRA
jgi:hypothetical protein